MSDNSLEVTGATLAGVEVFSDLGGDERNEIAKLCHGHRFQAHELIVSHLEKTGDVFFIVSGAVRITIYSKTGKEITFRDVSAGQMFGELSAIDGKPRSAHVIALGMSTVVFVSPDNFWRILGTYPSIAQKTFIYLSKLVRLLSDRVVEFSTLGVKNRIHAEILRLGLDAKCDKGVMIIVPAPTHAEIANRVSTHREAVTREIGVLTSLNIIRKERNTLIVQDIGKLQKMVDEVLNDERQTGPK